MIKKIASIFLLMIIHVTLFAQSSATDENFAGTMRSNGKIYVVVAVILAIFAGIILYLIRLDIKLTKLEKENKSTQLITK